MSERPPSESSHVGGAWIPARVLHHPDLSLAAKIVYGRLEALSRRDGACTASNSYLSDDPGISERQIRRYVRTLREEGLVHVEIEDDPPHGSRRSVYPVNPGGGGGHICPGGVDISVRSSLQEDKRSSTYTGGSPAQRTLEGIQGGNGTTPLDAAVDRVFQACRDLQQQRTGGPPIEKKESRLRKIRARMKEAVEHFGSIDDAEEYLKLAARGFYADDWAGRDKHLEIKKYLFDSETRVYGYAQDGAAAEAGLSEGDRALLRRRREMDDWNLGET